jgi:hypothetical protein
MLGEHERKYYEKVRESAEYEYQRLMAAIILDRDGKHIIERPRCHGRKSEK